MSIKIYHKKDASKEADAYKKIKEGKCEII